MKKLLGKIKKIWNSYMSGAEANDYTLYKCGLFGYKLKHPASLYEAIYVIDKMMSDEDKTFVRLHSEEDISTRLHHSFGRWMRNNWGLWETKKSPLYHWFKVQGIWHADDMSSIIIKSFCRKTKGQPIRLQEQIQEYLDYWESQSTQPVKIPEDI